MEQLTFQPIATNIYRLPISFKKAMRVPVVIVANKKIFAGFEREVFEQVANVASLYGLVDYVLLLPDAHSGYGAPIGTVFASDLQNNGIISPGAVGYDINCGMRLMTTELTNKEIKPYLPKLINTLFDYVPAGVGSSGFLETDDRELTEIMVEGAGFMVGKGLGREDDLINIEEQGRITGANPDKVSSKARERGLRQLGTLGSGNHYLEIQRVETIFDSRKAESWGIYQKDQIVVMVHCGSRGFGHQIATDYLRIFEKKQKKYNLPTADKQLVCAPFSSIDGQNYFQAMAAAANFAFANREVITYQVRQAFAQIFPNFRTGLTLPLLYDVAHNIAKIEFHQTQKAEGIKKDNSKEINNRKLLVHRKGATRSYKDQPVIIGGSMETGSYLMVGTDKAMEISFGSTAHGSGRTISRHQARRQVEGRELSQKMIKEGIIVKSASWSGLSEEAGFAYKNIADVVESVVAAEISLPVASFKPIGNIKG